MFCLPANRKTAISQECFLTLLQTHPVRHAKACASYLKDRIRATLHESHIYPDDVRVEEYQHLFKTVFFPRLLVITERIAVAKDSALPALDLCVYIKLDCLHGYFPFFCDAAHQRANCQIDSILKSILQPTKINRLKPVRKLRKAHSIQDDDAQARQPDAAYLCQSIRRFRAQYDFCDHAFTSDVYPQRKRGCVSVNTAVALDLLQRHAYTETKLNVYRVVGKKLPRELADIVLKYTLHGRGQPEEPGIFDRSGKAVIECGEASVRISRAELLSC
jgi:hypothetical protein